jgi:PAS domain S-box-containing protein
MSGGFRLEADGSAMFFVKVRSSLLLILVAASLACFPPRAMAEQNSSNFSAVLRSASELDYPPFSVVRKDGTADGFSVDLLKEVSRASGLRISFKVAPWNRIKQELASGKLDVLPLVAYSAERDRVFDFTAPYLQMHGTVFVRKGNTAIQTEADLMDKEVLVMRGDSAHEYATKYRLSNKLIPVSSFEEAMRLLSRGRHDAVLIQQLAGLMLIKKLGITNVVDVKTFRESSLKMSAKPLSGFVQKFSFAVREGEQELLSRLNEGLAIVIANGTYDRLYDEWFGPVLPAPKIPWTAKLRYVLTFTLPLLLILAMIGIWYLEREVKRKTAHLVAEIQERRQIECNLMESERVLRERESFLQTLINAIPIPVFYKDVQGRYLGGNQAFASFFGQNKEDFIGKTVLDILPKELAETYHQKDQALLEAGGHQRFESRLEIVSGKWRDVVFHKAAFLDSQGKVGGLIGVMQDMTQQKRLELQMQQAQKMEAIGTLAGGIAHDFNNMLSVIMGNISYALDGLPKLVPANEPSLGASPAGEWDELLEVLSEAQAGAKQAQSLTLQLLTFAKGGAPIKEATDLNRLVMEAAQFVSRGAKSKCIFDLAEDLWSVEVDKGQINQAIQNLVINANQAMPQGGTITIKSENIELAAGENPALEAGAYVKVTVADQGGGISDQHLERIFEPFYSTKQTGSGLGLATTYSILQRHGGHISAQSELGKGTVFQLCLPSNRQTPTKLESRPPAVKHVGRGKVLVMDDQTTILRMLSRMLTRMGYEATGATDGAQTIELFRQAHQSQAPYDLVILDLTIPGGIGGAETIGELLKIDPKVKAIVSSGYSNDPVMANYRQYGFSGVVAKPYVKDQLAALLDTILG